MSRFNVEAFIDVAIDTTHAAGKAIADLFGLRADQIDTSWKSDDTPVTVADRRSEELIAEHMRTAFPGLPLVLEESAPEYTGRDEYICLVDPLDGTSSFFRGIPTYAILIALAKRTRARVRTIACVVHEPQTGRVWHAAHGEGAYMCRYEHGSAERSSPVRISVSSAAQFPADKAMLIYDAAMQFRSVVPTVADKVIALSAVLPYFRRVRMVGSLAIQFAYVASGFAEATVADAVGGPYDLCGHLLVEEARGLTTDPFSGPVDIFRSKVVVATNGDRHEELVSVVRAAYSQFGDEQGAR